MHRYRITVQISLIFSILNLVLAAPVVVQEIHEARGDEMSTPPQPLPDAMAPPQHSSSSSLDGSTSSGYPTPYLSPDSSDSGYSWLLDRPPRLSPDLPVSLHEPASPYPSGSGSPEIQLPASFEPEEIPSSPPAAWGLAHPLHYPSSSGSSGSDRATTETYSPQDEFTPSHHPSSLSSTDWHPEESMSTPYSPASGGSPS
jgi:hypothetical protein